MVKKYRDWKKNWDSEKKKRIYCQWKKYINWKKYSEKKLLKKNMVEKKGKNSEKIDSGKIHIVKK